MSHRNPGAGPSLERMQDISDQIGEAFHTALRKASDHPVAWAAWKAIDRLPQDEWDAILKFVCNGLGLPQPTITGYDADDCPRPPAGAHS